jgi:hypothetical protein
MTPRCSRGPTQAHPSCGARPLRVATGDGRDDARLVTRPAARELAAAPRLGAHRPPQASVALDDQRLAGPREIWVPAGVKQGQMDGEVGVLVDPGNEERGAGPRPEARLAPAARAPGRSPQASRPPGAPRAGRPGRSDERDWPRSPAARAMLGRVCPTGSVASPIAISRSAICMNSGRPVATSTNPTGPPVSVTLENEGIDPGRSASVSTGGEATSWVSCLSSSQLVLSANLLSAPSRTLAGLA